jgi:hypothetical protein
VRSGGETIALHVEEETFDEPSNGARQRRALPRRGTILSGGVIRCLLGALRGGDHFNFYLRVLRQR